MTEHQTLGLMLMFIALLAVVGIFIGFRVYQESRDSTDKAREVELLVSASLDVARQILREVKKS